MLGLGLGLPFSAGRGLRLPPQYANMILWTDPTVGATDDGGGLISALASRKGSAVFAASGTQRPVRTSDYLTFNGTTNLMVRPSDAQSHPALVTRMTYAAWIYRSGTSGFISWYSGSNYTGSAAPAGYLMDYIGVARYAVANGDTFDTVSGDVALDAWRFRAWTFDGSLAPGSRIMVYEGATPETVAMVAAAESGTQTTTPDHIGNSYLGAAGAGTRLASGRIGHTGIWSGAALTLAELQAFAALTVPS